MGIALNGLVQRSAQRRRPGRACGSPHALVDAGADIIDLGAQSAALAADVVPAAAQVAALVPVVERLRVDGVAVSVDTDRAEVAEAVIDAGAGLVNGFSGQLDELLEVVAIRADYVLTHNPVGLRAQQADPDHYGRDVAGVSPVTCGPTWSGSRAPGWTRPASSWTPAWTPARPRPRRCACSATVIGSGRRSTSRCSGPCPRTCWAC